MEFSWTCHLLQGETTHISSVTYGAFSVSYFYPFFYVPRHTCAFLHCSNSKSRATKSKLTANQQQINSKLLSASPSPRVLRVFILAIGYFALYVFSLHGRRQLLSMLCKQWSLSWYRWLSTTLFSCLLLIQRTSPYSLHPTECCQYPYQHMNTTSTCALASVSPRPRPRFRCTTRRPRLS